MRWMFRDDGVWATSLGVSRVEFENGEAILVDLQGFGERYKTFPIPLTRLELNPRLQA